jgi:predicted membrane-bound spermidine synthase
MTARSLPGTAVPPARAASPADRTRYLLSALFFASGFCSLLYQVVWLRMAFAQFGIVTPVLSVVVSVFMLGLGVGALAGGRWVAPLSRSFGVSPAVLYGAAELLIGVGALAVPALLRYGGARLLGAGAAGSAAYLALSALAITVALLPWCLLMGATFPLMLAFVRACWPEERRGFSLLYRANVAGAAIGTVASAMVLIELFGFRGTSRLGALLNLMIAIASFAIARQAPQALPAAMPPRERTAAGPAARWQEVVLFTTGFCSLAMEVVWTRGFTIILHTTIYAFAAILATYLAATALGAALYRRALRNRAVPGDGWLLLAAAATACLPAVLDDPRLQAAPVGVLLSIAPFCAVLGFLTPKLLDDYAAGDPARAGRGYAVNILGSILGPLVAGYGLVTWVDPQTALLILALPMTALAGRAVLRATPPAGVLRGALAAPLALLLAGFGVSRGYEQAAHGSGRYEIHRDYAATAIAYGSGRDKGLLVNGVAITNLTPITKLMAHLPLAVHGQARDGLVICFGMGTTFRAMLAWGIETTAVDLTRSVMRTFGFFHADAERLFADPHAHLVVDDGRRFLLRNTGSFDVIVIDPPPPVEAAGSSLLYSREFYRVLKQRLRPGGILQQWFPGGEAAIQRAVVRALLAEFPYVVAYRSIEGWGYHFLAAMQPIEAPSAAAFAARLPAAAERDLIEWGPQPTGEAMAAAMLAGRTDAAAIAGAAGPAITDDRPVNEYFLLRRLARRLGVAAAQE